MHLYNAPRNSILRNRHLAHHPPRVSSPVVERDLFMPEDPISPTADKAEVVATPADFDEDGALTRDFLLRRRRCCQEGCRNCPYGFTAGDERHGTGPERFVM